MASYISTHQGKANRQIGAKQLGIVSDLDTAAVTKFTGLNGLGCALCSGGCQKRQPGLNGLGYVDPATQQVIDAMTLPPLLTGPYEGACRQFGECSMSNALQNGAIQSGTATTLSTSAIGDGFVAKLQRWDLVSWSIVGIGAALLLRFRGR